MVYLYLDYEDAKAALEEMKISNGLAESRILIMNLHRAYKLASPGSRVSGPSIDLETSDSFMAYKLRPPTASKTDARLVKLSAKLMKEGEKAFKETMEGRHFEYAPCLCFEAKGLYISRRDDKIRPLFLSLSDLEAAWAKQRERNPEMKAKPEILTHDLFGIIEALRNPYQEYGDFDLDDCGIVPDSKNIEYMESARRKGNSRSRLHLRL